MKKAGAAVLAICGTLGGPAAAASCVGADGETPLPGATGVEIRHADVPSALFGGTWQQGVLDGLAYQIHANGSAIIGDAPAMAGWRLDLTCDPQARRCNRVASGDAPAASAGVAARIEACLLGPAPAAPDFSGWNWVLVTLPHCTAAMHRSVSCSTQATAASGGTEGTPEGSNSCTP